MTFKLQLVLGVSQDIYDNFISRLPTGDDNLARGIVVPAHPKSQPPTLKILGVTPGIRHTLTFAGEWSTAPYARVDFVPNSDSHLVTVPLPYGPVGVNLRNTNGETGYFLLSVVNYAVFFSTIATELAENVVDPLSLLNASITSPFAYQLALPLLVNASEYIPADLESLVVLSNKLLIKSLLHRPGTEGAAKEILSAFSASTPYFFPMRNLGKLDAPLYRSEEVFSGYEAHVWLPNREIERWRAFIQLLNNIPQLYTLQQVTEGEIFYLLGGQLHQNIFDFESPFANSIVEGVGVTSECFLNLFTLSMNVVSEHFLAFCQASYPLDSYISGTGLQTPDTDLLSVTNWRGLSLTGRFEQQYDISTTHKWHYEVPSGVVDGFNRYFYLSKQPSTTPALKVFIDGLLQHLYVDYRLGYGTNFRSDILEISNPATTLVIETQTGATRPFLGPVLYTLEASAGTDLQLLVTGGDQDLNSVSFVISDPPKTVRPHPENINIHYAIPAVVNSTFPVNTTQYGTEPVPVGTSTYDLVFPTPTLTVDYQLVVSLTVQPFPLGNAAKVTQVAHIVRGHNLTGASIEFSAPISDPNTFINWMVIEADNIALERGTVEVPAGSSSVPITFTSGPYLDRVVVLAQLWNAEQFLPADLPLMSLGKVNVGATTAEFSQTIETSGYRVDYFILQSSVDASNALVFNSAPVGLVEAHYDSKWPHWVNSRLTPETDGILNRFNLPVPIPNPKAMYLTLNGRLLTQGNNAQYVVEDGGGSVRLTFAPSRNQILWACYPIADADGQLPSRWDQGSVLREADYNGAYATGYVENTSVITPGDSLSFKDRSFMAVPPALGIVTNNSFINIGDQLAFVELGVTFTGTPDPSTPTEFAVGVSRDADGEALVSAINSNPTTSAKYFAAYQGSGVIHIKGLALGSGFYNQTLTTFGTSLSATDILGDSTDCSYSHYTIKTPSHYLTFAGTNVQQSLNNIFFLDHGLFSDLPVVFTTNGVSPLSSGTTYYVVNPTPDTFQLAAIPGGPPILLVGAWSDFTLSSKDIDPTFSFLYIQNHTFVLNEPVRFTTENGVLPGGVSTDDIFYVVNPDTNSFQVSLVPSGPGYNLTTSGEGDITILALGHFAAGVSQELDSLALANAINADPLINVNYTAIVPTAGRVQITANKVGKEWDAVMASSGDSLTHQDLLNGEDPSSSLPFTTNEVYYSYDAPVVALNGLSTRLYKGYSGNKLKMTYPPTDKQEAYYISETFPIDYHPLDSTTANEPCNYPKGVFTQGVLTQLTDFSYTVPYTGTLQISTRNLPVQQEPFGAVDGVNTLFTLTTVSCAGQASLMLWIDGVFQPPTTYTYTENFGIGEITLSQPPQEGQKIWCWYLSLGDLCVDERMVELTGTIDGTNQIFSVPDSPWVNDAGLVLFLEGLFQLQGVDYITISGNTEVQYLGSIAPQVGQSLWAHFNLGAILADPWRQVRVGTTDGTTTDFSIPHLLDAELPTSPGSVLVFLDGLCQREGVDFQVPVNQLGFPTGEIIFTGGAPEAGRLLDVAYIQVS